MKQMSDKDRIRSLTEGAVAIALTIVLSYLQLWRMPQGGSVTLENIPLLIYALRRGGRKGIVVGVAAGLIQLLLGGYVVHPIQALLDYPVAFGALGVAGALRISWLISVPLALFLRFLCHVASGVVFFAAYAPEGTHPVVYSAIYNGTFMLPGLAVSMFFIWMIGKKTGLRGN